MWLTLRTIDSLFDRFERSLSEFGHFPKENDPNYEYTQEKIESEGVVSIKETWRSNRSIFTRVSSTPKEKKLDEKEIRRQITKAVSAENYEQAAKLKKLLKKKGE
jgi:hypothetical protein